MASRLTLYRWSSFILKYIQIRNPLQEGRSKSVSQKNPVSIRYKQLSVPMTSIWTPGQGTFMGLVLQNLFPTRSRLQDVQIWKSTTDAHICTPLEGTSSLDPSLAFSKYLGRDVLLVYKGRTTRYFTSEPLNLKGPTAFQDGYPILVATEESLRDVQAKVELSASGAEGWGMPGVVDGGWNGEIVMERCVVGCHSLLTPRPRKTHTLPPLGSDLISFLRAREQPMRRKNGSRSAFIEVSKTKNTTATAGHLLYMVGWCASRGAHGVGYVLFIKI